MRPSMMRRPPRAAARARHVSPDAVRDAITWALIAIVMFVMIQMVLLDLVLKRV